MSTKTTQVKRITIDEFHTRIRAQGVPREHVATRCPMCGTVQSMTSLVRAGAAGGVEEVEKYFGYSCVGRWTGAGSPSQERGKRRGCNWTLGGLLRMHKLEVVTEDGTAHPTFEPVSADEARALMESYEATDEH